MDIPNNCRECGGQDLRWFADVENTGPAVDGRIKANEMQNIFVLGCEDCCETIKVVSGNEIAELLNDKKKQNVT